LPGAAAAREARGTIQDAGPRPTVVLIVEDELLVRLFVNDVLEEAG
jgi:hypothetical protein